MCSVKFTYKPKPDAPTPPLTFGLQVTAASSGTASHRTSHLSRHARPRPRMTARLLTSYPIVGRSGRLSWTGDVPRGPSSLFVLVAIAVALVATEDVHARIAGRRRTGRIG